MGLAEFERKREEKIDGVIYDMSPRPHFLHGVINGNIYRIISAGLQCRTGDLSEGASTY